MLRIIKELDLQDGRLNVVTSGMRSFVANLTGKVMIYEKTSEIAILGNHCKGKKHIYASFIACDKESYFGDKDIHSGMVFDANGEVQRTDGVYETVYFAGLQMEDSNPAKSTITFAIPDYELIARLLKM